MVAKKAAPRKAAPKSAVVETSPAAPAAGDSLLAGLYPKDADLWWYTARNGTRIPFPRYSTVTAPTRAFWRRLYGLDEVFQAFEWMRWAGVPEPVQALTDQLDDDEYESMFNAWFQDADLTSGE